MLGSNLALFFNDVYKVIALHRDSSCLVNVNDDYSVDIRDSQLVKKIIQIIEPDIIIHCAGLTKVDMCEEKPDLAYQINVEGTRNITKSCNSETLFIYISTDAVYGNSNDHSEQNKDLNQINQYARTKYLGEGVVRNTCEKFIIIRTNMFGWNIKPNRLSSAEWIYHTLKKGEKITLFKDYLFSPVYAGLLGEIIKKLIDMDFSGTINVGSLVPYSKYEFGFQLAKEFNLNHNLIKAGSIKNHLFKAKRVSNLVLDNGMLKSLGLDVPTVNKSIRRFRNKLILNEQ